MMREQSRVSCRRLLCKAHMVEEGPAIETSLASVARKAAKEKKG